MSLAARWRAAPRWERAVWVASALLLVLALVFRPLLRAASPRLACEVAAFEGGWNAFERSPALRDDALDPWGREWIPVEARPSSSVQGFTPSRLLRSAGPDGRDDGGDGDDVRVTGDVPGALLFARLLILTAAALPLHFLYATSVRAERQAHWAREVALVAVTAIPALVWSWILALMLAIGTGILDRRQPFLVVSPFTGLTLAVSLLVVIASIVARLLRRGERET